MQNFKKNKRKMNTNHMMNMPLASEEAVDKDASEELERGCAKKKCYEKVCDNECIKKKLTIITHIVQKYYHVLKNVNLVKFHQIQMIA